MTKKIHHYNSDKIDISWDKTRCLHVAECVLGLRAVFDTSKTPWIDPQAADASHIAAVIHRCPTGALQYESKAEGLKEIPDAQNTIRVAVDGPLYVRGDVALTVGGESVKEIRMALCRCGHSTKKPYCDGSHTRVGFEDNGHGTSKTVAETLPSGPINVTPRANGSILIEGPFEVQSSDGRILYRGEKVSLCRCGGSQSKPFCDGSHKTNGFVAE